MSTVRFATVGISLRPYCNAMMWTLMCFEDLNPEQACHGIVVVNPF